MSLHSPSSHKSVLQTAPTWRPHNILTYRHWLADRGGRVVQGLCLRPVVDWDLGFESRRGHGCLSLVTVVSLSATSRSLVRRSHTECSGPECDVEISSLSTPRHTRCCRNIKQNECNYVTLHVLSWIFLGVGFNFFRCIDSSPPLSERGRNFCGFHGVGCFV